MRRIRADFPTYELANARVLTARADRPCCHRICGKVNGVIKRGEDYVRVNAGIEFCHYHFEPEDVVEVTP